MIIDAMFEHGHVKAGQVVIQYANGEVYKGTLDGKQKRTARGSYYYLNGDSFEGQWANDVREGKGKLLFADGGIFEGEFNKDEICKGKYRDKDGNLYESVDDGCFVRGKLQGKGKMRRVQGDTYEGEFQDGKCSGQGKMIYKNMDEYGFEDAVYEG